MTYAQLEYKQYPNTAEERAQRTAMEKAAGRKRTMIAMADGLVRQMQDEMGVTASLNTEGDDFRKWTVVVQIRGVSLEELFLDFPTLELKAKIMLMRGY